MMAPNLQQQIHDLGPWFHNIHLPDGTETAPNHFLGDFPASKWAMIEPEIPEDLEGKRVLDIGCNAGFYTLRFAERGAQVTAIDLDPSYLRQAEWILEIHGQTDRVTLRQQQVYDLSREEETYDWVLFLGVFYHLRYPLLALDIISRLTNEQLIFQTLTMPGNEFQPEQQDYSLHEREQLLDPDWPKMAFIEHEFNGDPTNWWLANPACVEAMMRSCGFSIVSRPGGEIFICQPDTQNPSVIDTWNESEYLSAIQREWDHLTHRKVGNSDD